MKFDVYAIKDLEKGEFAQPFFVPEGTDETSVKINFKRIIEKGDSELSYFPERFELWQLAIFDSCCEDGHSGYIFSTKDIVDMRDFLITHCVAKGIDYARPEYVKALAEVKAAMGDNEEKID